MRRGSVFVVMGGSGSGKSVLVRHMLGLLEPARGEVLYNGESFTGAEPEQRAEMLRRVGILYQRNALWSSMTLAENIALPLQEYTDLSEAEIREIAELKLALVGLRGFEDYMPSQISGGMQKRAALARAMALDPEVLFFDEPSSGLDPVTASRLDDLMLELRDDLGATLVVVSHDLASVLTIGDDSIPRTVPTRPESAAIGPPAAPLAMPAIASRCSAVARSSTTTPTDQLPLPISAGVRPTMMNPRSSRLTPP